MEKNWTSKKTSIFTGLIDIKIGYYVINMKAVAFKVNISRNQIWALNCDNDKIIPNAIFQLLKLWFCQ